MKCHGALCFILHWHAVLCYVTSCYCIFKVVCIETIMDGSVQRISVPYPFIWFANMSHVFIICWTGLCKFTFQNVCVCGVMLHCNAGCYTNHYLNSKEVCGLAPCYVNMPCLSHVIHAITFCSDDHSSGWIPMFVLYTRSFHVIGNQSMLQGTTVFGLSKFRVAQWYGVTLLSFNCAWESFT